jgi:DNA polymerase III subunit gamma/tau
MIAPMDPELPYQVIARRFRPQAFAAVLGQESIVTTLKNALRLHKVGTAYLFCGLRGSGKTTLARLFCKALNCDALGVDLEPCNRCPSCLEIAAGKSLDVLEIDGASNRGIDDIRRINETAAYAPSHGKYKIYLIDEVHMLTKEAFNALLKTLEEPPQKVKFFFATTEPHKVLPTILSRCQRFDLKPLSLSATQEKLRVISRELNIEIEERVFALIAERAEGSLRDAESLLDQMICYAEGAISLDKASSILGLTPKQIFFELDQAMVNGELSFAFELTEKIYTLGRDPTLFLESLMDHLRSLLVIKLQKGSTDERERQAAALYTEEQCLYLLDYLIRSFQEMAKSSFKRIFLEAILLHYIRSRHRLPLDALVKRLIDLESRHSPAATPIVDLPKPLAMTEKRPLLQEPILAKPSLQQRHEALIRFAAVELEGTLKKAPT